MPEFDVHAIAQWRSGYRFQFEPAQQTHVLLYPEGMIKLNPSAAAIGELIDGQRSTAQIIALLEQKYPEAAELPEDVCEFMQVAEHQHWLELKK